MFCIRSCRITPRITRRELRTLAEFAAYEKAQGRSCALHCGDEALKTVILADLADRVFFVENDCADIWEWSEKVYRIIEAKCAGE